MYSWFDAVGRALLNHSLAQVNEEARLNESNYLDQEIRVSGDTYKLTLQVVKYHNQIIWFVNNYG
jgi:hypothetical protein